MLSSFWPCTYPRIWQHWYAVNVPVQLSNTGTFCVFTVYRLCQKKLYNFQFLIAEKVNEAHQQHFGGQNIIFLCVRRFLNGIGIIPWSGVKVMVHCVMSGKNKVGHFRHYYESHGLSPVGETHCDLRLIKADVAKQPYLLDSSRPSDLNMPKIILFGNAWPTQTHYLNLFIHFTLILFVYCLIPSMQFRYGYLALWFTRPAQVENWLVQTNYNISTYGCPIWVK